MAGRRVLIAGILWAAGAAGSCVDYYADRPDPRLDPARGWCGQGGYFTFNSTANPGQSAELFWRCAGDPARSAIVLGHGWPTSSFDFAALSALLEPQLHVCSIDYVGHGFSDKPRPPWRYHIADHAQAVLQFVRWRNLSRFAYLTHDEGSSVGLRLLQMSQQAELGFRLLHHFLLDGSIYLPLANISFLQRALLSNLTGPVAQHVVHPEWFAAALGRAVYTPQLNGTQVAALASVFGYQNGTSVMHETIQYLQDRKLHEVEWLEALKNSSTDTALIWGMLDPVATPAIADFVWENYLRDRPRANATYTRIQGANHYLQVDHASRIAELVLATPWYK